MNPSLKGRDIRTAFAGDEFQILLVANKFQTGFDQPLPCAMYVDKELGGVNAVQTLSRLNRVYPGKDKTFVLDFVNEPEEILQAFEPYYKTATLSGVTDPNLIHELQSKLDDARIYTGSEVEAFANSFFDPKGKQKDLQAWIAPAVERFRAKWEEAEEEAKAGHTKALDELKIFRKDLSTFVGMYDFLSQIINYGDTELESRSIFFRHLSPLLKAHNLKDKVDLSLVQLTHYKLELQEQRSLVLGGSENAQLKPMAATGSGVGHEAEKLPLVEVIELMNKVFEGEFSQADVSHFVSYVRDKMLENPVLEAQAQINTKDQFEHGSFQGALTHAILSGLEKHQDMASQVFKKEETRKKFEKAMLDVVYNALRHAKPTLGTE